MNPLLAWNLDPLLVAALLLVGAIYLRGWSLTRSQVQTLQDGRRLASFLFGLLLLFLASDSPLDAFDEQYLSVHMLQHLLLMMFAPAFVVWGYPVTPLVRGLPRALMKRAVGPMVRVSAVGMLFRFVALPPVAFTLFAVSTIAWHVPALYELALRSERWHAVEHASFFWTGLLFWWAVIVPPPGKRRWPLWASIPYLVFADLINTALSAFLVFSDRVLYPSYVAARSTGLTVRDDQTLAGAIMWVPGSVIYLVPAIVIAAQLVSPPRAAEHTIRTSR